MEMEKINKINKWLIFQKEIDEIYYSTNGFVNGILLIKQNLSLININENPHELITNA